MPNNPVYVLFCSKSCPAGNVESCPFKALVIFQSVSGGPTTAAARCDHGGSRFKPPAGDADAGPMAAACPAGEWVMDWWMERTKEWKFYYYSRWRGAFITFMLRWTLQLHLVYKKKFLRHILPRRFCCLSCRKTWVVGCGGGRPLYYPSHFRPPSKMIVFWDIWDDTRERIYT